MPPSPDPRSLVLEASAGLIPGLFAIVMATGIIATDARSLGHTHVANTLLVYAILVYFVLVLLTGVRLVRFADRLRADLDSPGMTFAFLTFVAGSGVLASQAVWLERPGVTIGVGLVALVAWLYLLPRAATTAMQVPRGLRHTVARGNWLLAVVSTQSLSIVASVLAPHGQTSFLLRSSLVLWMLGLVFYGLIIVPVTRRMLSLLRTQPTKITGDFWITMGALAISTLATAKLLTAMSLTGNLGSFRDAVHIAGYVIWGVCTAWIPLLVVTEFHILRASGLPRYDPNRWSTVFPLGMYAAGSGALGMVLGTGFMQDAFHLFSWLAIVAWTFATLGLWRGVAGRVRPSVNVVTDARSLP